MTVTFDDWLNSSFEGMSIRAHLRRFWIANGFKFSVDAPCRLDTEDRVMLAHFLGIMDCFAFQELGAIPEFDLPVNPPEKQLAVKNALVARWRSQLNAEAL